MDTDFMRLRAGLDAVIVVTFCSRYVPKEGLSVCKETASVHVSCKFPTCYIIIYKMLLIQVLWLQ
jgi:hypothetical protein